MSTNSEQTLRQHNAGRAADCWQHGGEGVVSPTRFHISTLLAIMVISYTGLFIAPSCKSRFSYGN